MEVNINNDSNKREYINSTEVNKKVQEVLLSLQNFVNNASSKIKNEWIPTAKEWINQIGEVITTEYVYENVELLTKDQLIEIIKNNKVNGSDSNIVYKTMKKDGSFHVAITYIKDGEIIQTDENVIVIIECDGISRELKEIFGDQDFLIVK